MMLHSHVIVDGFDVNVFVGFVAIDMHLNFSKVGFAHKVFDNMPERDIVLWNTIFRGF